MDTLLDDANQFALYKFPDVDLIGLTQDGERLMNLSVELGPDVFAFERHQPVARL